MISIKENADVIEMNRMTADDVIEMLKITGNHEMDMLFRKANEIRHQYSGNRVFLRGLIEYSNICSKNCYYCGIRENNKSVFRYKMSVTDVLEAVWFAVKNNLGSVVIQSGELTSSANTEEIRKLIKQIKSFSGNKLAITLSCGEQTEDTYIKWRDAGAERYLLRIETTDKKLFENIHPKNSHHSFEKRLEALNNLKKCGYQVGTGVMIGLPDQTVESLARDILFMRDFDIDMCGMGPYIEHNCTPLALNKSENLKLEERYNLALKMIAVLRIVMKDVNIASTTAFQAINNMGKINALDAGANVIMPNITECKYKSCYSLYNNKPGIENSREAELKTTLDLIYSASNVPGFNESGDSVHFLNKIHANIH